MRFKVVLVFGLLTTFFLQGCATTITGEYTTNPSGANIYAGDTPYNLGYLGTTPYVQKHTGTGPYWLAHYFQFKKAGYIDSEIIFAAQLPANTNRKVWATLVKKSTDNTNEVNLDAWRKYTEGGLHRAYAKGKYGIAYASWSRTTPELAILEALSLCGSYGGVECQVTHLDGSPYNETQPKPKSAPVPITIEESTLISTGTGFFLTAKGQIITNAHVVDGCSFARILYENKGYDVSLLEIDQHNDLALLQSTITGNKAAPIEIDRLPRLGEPVIVFGYPLSSVLSSKPKITDGIISSTAGLGDDSRFFQISAPIQPGNSGGPLLDKFGRVIGITTAKLDDSWAIENTGSIAQNVNFAIKSIVVRTFLDSNNVVIKKPKQAPRQMSLPDIAEAADSYTVQVGCFK